MTIDPSNPIVQLCAHGMELEGLGQPAQAAATFQLAWTQASNHFEKHIAAHYIARHQPTITDKLHWDQLALHHALAINDESANPHLPSLYLNIAKCYEDLHQPGLAIQHYNLASNHLQYLTNDGYSKMIQSGIRNALARLTAK